LQASLGLGLGNPLLQLEVLDGGLQGRFLSHKQHLQGQLLDGIKATLKDGAGGMVTPHAINGNRYAGAAGAVAGGGVKAKPKPAAKNGASTAYKADYRPGAAIPDHQPAHGTAGPGPPAAAQ
jgi:hypothetical protein